MTPIGLLSEFIAQQTKLPAAAYRGEPEYQLLLRCGYVIEAGILRSLLCDECDTPHEAEIVFVEGQYGYHCPELGFVAVERAAIEAVSSNVASLVDDLANAFQCHRKRSTPLHGQTWRIGSWAAENIGVMIYFHPCLRTEDELRDLEAALAGEVRSPWRLIVTASGGLSPQVGKTTSLADIVELAPCDGRLIPVATPGELVGAPGRKQSGAPNRYGDRLKDLIAKRANTEEALKGRNEEAKALLVAFKASYPNDDPPSLPSIRRYVSAARSET